MNINLDHFKFSTPLAMRWNDMDALGHVNNIYYFEYFQIARGQYVNAVSKQWDWTEHMFVIAHIECDYLKELKLTSSNVRVKTRTSFMSTKSFELEYVVVSEGKNGEDIVHAKGKSIQVMIDMQAKTSIAIPQWLREDIINYEPEL